MATDDDNDAGDGAAVPAVPAVRLVNGRLVPVDPATLGEYLAPPPPAPPPLRAIAPLAFRRRLGAALGPITLAAAQALAAGDPTLQLFVDNLAAARQVELDHPETVDGLAALVAAGLLPEAAVAALLADGAPEEAPA